MNRDDYIRELKVLEDYIKMQEKKMKALEVDNDYLKERIAELEMSVASVDQALAGVMKENASIHSAYDKVIRGKIKPANDILKGRFPGLWEDELKSEILRR